MADIASLFKKVIGSMPGGLLGSLELFEVLYHILLIWEGGVENSKSQAGLHAYVIALAISSLSQARTDLIQAVIGLIAYFSCEGDEVQRADNAATNGQELQDHSRSEIMGYDGFARVFAPLLLSSLEDGIDVNRQLSESGVFGPAPDSAETDQEGGKESNEGEQVASSHKLKPDPTFSAPFKRTSLTRTVMQLVLLHWTEIVEQLYYLNSQSGSRSQLPGTVNYCNPPSVRPPNRLMSKSSEEEMHVFEISQAREQNMRLPCRDRMRRRVEMTNRSPTPISRPAVGRFDESNASRTFGSDIHEEHHASLAGSNESHARIDGSLSTPSLTQNHLSEELSTLYSGTNIMISDTEMDRMAMGTILIPRSNSYASLEHPVAGIHDSPTETPRHSSRELSSDFVPQTAFRNFFFNYKGKT